MRKIFPVRLTGLLTQVNFELSELDLSLVGSVFWHQAAVAVYVGEYSLNLAPQTWGKAPIDQKERLMKRFRLARSQIWQGNAHGSASGTLEWESGWEWDSKLPQTMVSSRHLMRRR